jgi:hypothetical protein
VYFIFVILFPIDKGNCDNYSQRISPLVSFNDFYN